MEICFDADNVNRGIHPLHCHMGFHMMAGMITTVEYIDDTNPAVSVDKLVQQQEKILEEEAKTYKIGLLGGAYSIKDFQNKLFIYYHMFFCILLVFCLMFYS